MRRKQPLQTPSGNYNINPKLRTCAVRDGTRRLASLSRRIFNVCRQRPGVGPGEGQLLNTDVGKSTWSLLSQNVLSSPVFLRDARSRPFEAASRRLKGRIKRKCPLEAPNRFRGFADTQ